MKFKVFWEEMIPLRTLDSVLGDNFSLKIYAAIDFDTRVPYH